MRPSLLQVDGVVVATGTSRRLDQMDLSVDAGTVTVLLGENGSGKSSLLDACAGLLPIQGGHITLNGIALAELSAADRVRLVASVGQRDPANPHIRVWQRIAQGLVRPGALDAWRGADSRARVEPLADALDLTALLDRRVQDLSGGEHRRVSVARALLSAEKADLLLVDEPFAGVDLRHQPAVALALDGLRAQGKAVVVASHRVAWAERAADQVVGLRKGAVVGHLKKHHRGDRFPGAFMESVFGVSRDGDKVPLIDPFPARE